jgi:hypothetical protein
VRELSRYWAGTNTLYAAPFYGKWKHIHINILLSDGKE